MLAPWWGLVVVLAGQAPPADDCQRTVAGLVVDEETGEALPQVRVRSRGASTTTNDEGRFVLEGLCGDSASLTFERADYAPRTLARSVDDDSAVLLRPRRLTRLDDVVVLAPPPLDGDELQTAATLDEEELKRLRGRNLAATLAEVPGVTMLRAGPQEAKPVVRGQFGRRLLTLFDGVRHEGQDWALGHAPEIDPFAAGNLKVVKGAAGVRYGPDAVGGVVLVEPRPLRITPGADGDLLLVGVDNGYRSTVAGRIDAVHPTLPGLALRLEGNLSKTAAVKAPTYVLGNTGSEVANMAATVGYAGDVLGLALEGKLTLRRYEAKLGICYCGNAGTPADLQAQSSLGRPQGVNLWSSTYDVSRPASWVRHDTVLARGSVELGPVGKVTATYAFQADNRDEYDQARRAVQGPQLEFNLFTHTADVLFEHAPLSAGRFTLRGLGGGQVLYQENIYAGLRLIPNFRRFTGGAFWTERLRIRNVGPGDVEVEAGVRYDQLLQTAFLSDRAYSALVRTERLEADACELYGDAAWCPKNLPGFTFTAGARWYLDVLPWPDAIVLRGDVSSAARFPDADELYLSGRAPSFPIFGLGDGSLGTETTTQAALSLELRTPYLVADASVFGSRVDGYIAFGPEIGPSGRPRIDVTVRGAFPRFTYRSTTALFYGVDGGAVLAPGALLSMSAAVSVVQGQDLEGRYLPFVPPPQGRLELISNLPDFYWLKGPVARARSTLVTQQRRSDISTDFTPAPPGYMIFDAEVSAGVDVLGAPLNIGFEVRNLLNQAYRDYLSLLRYYADQPGREVWLRVGLSFG